MHFFLNLHQLKFIFSIILTCMMTSIFYRMNLLTLQIKWICPTAPTRPVAILGGFPCTACKIDWSFLVNAILEYFISMVFFLMFWYWLKSRTLLLQSSLGFDVGELSDDGPEDWEGLDASAAHIANLLSTEPVDGTSQGQIVSKTNNSRFQIHQHKFMVQRWSPVPSISIKRMWLLII